MTVRVGSGQSAVISYGRVPLSDHCRLPTADCPLFDHLGEKPHLSPHATDCLIYGIMYEVPRSLSQSMSRRPFSFSVRGGRRDPDIMDPDDTAAPELAPESATARRVKTALGYLLAMLCLAWVIYHIHPKHLVRGIKQLRWEFVLLGIAADNFSFLLQGLRWKLLLGPVRRVRLIRAIQAIYIGLFTSDVFPLRFGEIARAYIMSQWYSIRISEIIPSIVVERMFDGVWLALGVGLVTASLPLPSYFQTAAQIFGGIIVLLAIAFLYAVLREEREIESGIRRRHRRLFRRITFFIDEVAIGLRKIGISAIFFLALAVSLGALLMQGLAVWLLIHAYGLPLTPWEGMVVYLVVRLGIVIPTAPANIGTYQFFVALGLELFGILRPIAVGFSFVLFFILSVPLWVLGFFALSRTGVTLFRLHRDAAEAVKERS